MKLKPREPPAAVWRGIERRLRLASEPALGGRRLLALAASLVLVVALGTLGYWRFGATSRTSQVANITTAAGALVWQVELSGTQGAIRQLVVHAAASAAPPRGRDYELWALPSTGKPVSLGVLPYEGASSRVTLNASQQRALVSAAQLAVSLEPRGGSPTAQPTGAVVFVVPLRRVT